MASSLTDPALLHACLALIAEARLASAGRLVVIGIAGAQGSGKSTLARALEQALGAQGVAAATLSLDDLYLTRAERMALAAREHPLLATRGVPGTHDVALGLATLAALASAEPAALPRFDKARDDRLPAADWPRAPRATQVLLFEGWCIGARPQPEEALADPVNALEAEEDRDGRWRRRANAALAGAYARLFARIDRLVLLAAPGFDVVARWRDEQEQALRAERGPSAPGLMDATQIARFVAFYERITRAMLAEMPARADLVVRLTPDRAIAAIELRANG